MPQRNMTCDKCGKDVGYSSCTTQCCNRFLCVSASCLGISLQTRCCRVGICMDCHAKCLEQTKKCIYCRRDYS